MGRRAAAGVPAALRRAACRRLRRRGTPGAHLAQRLRPLSSALARLNPDLIASWEGGSNRPWSGADRWGRVRSPSGASWCCARHAGPSAGRWRSPGSSPGLCVANLHASTDRPGSRRRRCSPRPTARSSGPAARRWSSAATSTCGRGRADAFERARAAPRPLRADGARGDRPPAGPGPQIVAQASQPWPAERRELARRRPARCGSPITPRWRPTSAPAVDRAPVR